MAEGGYDPTTENETPWEDHGIDHDDDDDDDEEYTTPRSSPMKPPPPEEVEMSWLPREQKSKWQLSTKQAAWIAVKKIYPQANEDALEVDYERIPGVKKPRLSIKMIGSTKNYWLFEKDFLGRWKENQYLPPPIKSLLGKTIEEQIKELKQLKSEKESELAAKQKQKKQLEQKADEKQKLSRDMDSLTNEIRDVDEQKRELEDAHGPFDTETIQKLKDDKRALEGEKKTIQQQISRLQKDIIQYNTIQEEVNQLRHDTGELDQHLNELRAKEETLKPLDELNKKRKSSIAKSKKTSSSLRMKTPHPANGRPRKLGFQKMKLSWTGLTQRLRCGKGKGPCSKGLKTSSKSTAGPFKLFLWLSASF